MYLNTTKPLQSHVFDRKKEQNGDTSNSARRYICTYLYTLQSSLIGYDCICKEERREIYTPMCCGWFVPASTQNIPTYMLLLFPIFISTDDKSCIGILPSVHLIYWASSTCLISHHFSRGVYLVIPTNNPLWQEWDCSAMSIQLELFGIAIQNINVDGLNVCIIFYDGCVNCVSLMMNTAMWCIRNNANIYFMPWFNQGGSCASVKRIATFKWSGIYHAFYFFLSNDIYVKYVLQ